MRESGYVEEAAWVAAVLGIDPIVHLADADHWSRAARIAAAEMIAQAREEANRG